MKLIQTGCEEVELYQAIGAAEDQQRFVDLVNYRFAEMPTEDERLSWEWGRTGRAPSTLRVALRIARAMGRQK